MYFILSVLLATASPSSPEAPQQPVVENEEVVFLENPEDLPDALPSQEIAIDDSVTDLPDFEDED